MVKAEREKIKSLYFPKRITEAMDGIFDHPLTVVEAPIGYGKTTAVREYLNQTDVLVLWQIVYDNSVAGFWKGFSRLIAKKDEISARNLLDLGFPNDSVLMQEALRIIEEIEFPSQTVLVVDDYHLIEKSGVNCFIEFLTLNEITNLHIVLIARFTELFNFEELTLKSYLHHITKETFELMPEEIVAYYKICGVSLRHEEAVNLYNLTEGWISALYLFMLELVTTGEYTPENNIYKLIEKAIYTPFTTEIKHFLLTMCVFDSFTLEQAVYMWEQENSNMLLTEITSKNAFVKYDGKTKTYQVHNLFTGFLKEVLTQKDTRYRRELYQKAARWHLERGDYYAARLCFYTCGDFDGILSALEADWLNYEAENQEQIRKYMDECPQEVKARHPYAMLKFAMHLFCHYETAQFSKICDEFNRNLAMDERLDDDSKKRLLGEYQLLLSFTAFNDLKKMLAYHQQAWKLLNRPTAIYDTKSNWTFGSLSVLYLYYRESGRLERHIGELRDTLAYYTRLTDGHGSGADYVMEAERFFNMGDFVNTAISVYKALDKARPKRQTGLIISALFLQIRLAFMKGDFGGIVDLFKEMRAEVTGERQYRILHTVDMGEGYIYALLKRTDKIVRWITTGNSAQVVFPAFGMLNIVYGRVLLSNGEYLKLIGSAEHFFRIASVFPNLLGHIYTYIYLAAANKQIYKEAEALSNLKQALDIALPDKLYMPFVENCDYIKPLLDKLYESGHYREGIAKILELYVVHENAVKQIIREHFSGEKPKLTGRELEIARLAAEGLTNKAIGARLFISENTVKKELKTIFKKLGINSRVLLKQSLDEVS